MSSTKRAKVPIAGLIFILLACVSQRSWADGCVTAQNGAVLSTSSCVYISGGGASAQISVPAALPYAPGNSAQAASSSNGKTCFNITNNNALPIMAPATYAGEWQSFLNNPGPNIAISDCDRYSWVTNPGSCSADLSACSASVTSVTGTQDLNPSCQQYDEDTGATATVGAGYCASAAPAATQSCTVTCPSTGTWTPSHSCDGYTYKTTYSCTGGDGICSGSQPADKATAHSVSCDYPTGSWTATPVCNGYELDTTYSCTGGDGYCAGDQPASSAIPNSANCGYVAPTGTWVAQTNCSGTTQITTYVCTGGNDQCATSQPAGSSSPNSGNCGYPTGSWTAGTYCSGTTQVTTYSCTGGNGLCSGGQPADINTANSSSCGYVAPVATVCGLAPSSLSGSAFSMVQIDSNTYNYTPSQNVYNCICEGGNGCASGYAYSLLGNTVSVNNTTTVWSCTGGSYSYQCSTKFRNN